MFLKHKLHVCVLSDGTVVVGSIVDLLNICICKRQLRHVDNYYSAGEWLRLTNHIVDKNDPEREPITGNYKESCQTLGVGTRMLALVRRRSISRFKRPAATQATLSLSLSLSLSLPLPDYHYHHHYHMIQTQTLTQTQTQVQVQMETQMQIQYCIYI